MEAVAAGALAFFVHCGQDVHPSAVPYRFGSGGECDGRGDVSERLVERQLAPDATSRACERTVFAAL